MPGRTLAGVTVHEREGLTFNGPKGTKSNDGGEDEEEDSADDEGGSDAEDPGVVDRLVDYGPANAGDTVEGEGEDS